MLRGVNVGPHHRIKMDTLRAVYESLKLEEPRTYIQSGNVLFRAKEKNGTLLAKKIQKGIEGAFGFRPEVMLRTTQELRKTIASNPFAGRVGIEPSKLLVTFLAAEPSSEAQATLAGLNADEELHLRDRELYIYFPNGVGNAKLPWSKVENLVRTAGTARNWTSVIKMLELAEEMETAG